MAHAEWDPQLNTGDEVVDMQHRNLYAIVNELDDALEEGRENKTVALVLVRVLLHAKTHFHDEESLMQRVGYPDLAQHHELHEKFERDAEQLSDEYLAGGAVSPTALSEFLRTWLLDHIGVEDRRLAEFIQSQHNS